MEASQFMDDIDADVDEQPMSGSQVISLFYLLFWKKIINQAIHSGLTPPVRFFFVSQRAMSVDKLPLETFDSTPK